MRTETRPSGIGLEAVEAALRSHPSVDDCAVLLRHAASGPELVVYVVPDGPFVPDRLRAHLQAVLPDDHLPNGFVPVAALPLTPAGAIDEEALSRLEVIDAELVERWEACLQTQPGIEQAAVVVQAHFEDRRALHLSDLIPGWTADPNGDGQSAARAAVEVQAAEAEPVRPAYSDGGPLAIPADAPKNFVEAILRTANEHSSKGIIFVQADGTELGQTYAELLHEARCLLSGLRAHGLKPGDRVILQADSLRDHFTTFWACVLGGIIPVTVAIAPSYAERNAVVNKFYNSWQLLKRPTILTSGRLLQPILGLARLWNERALHALAIDELKHCLPAETLHECRPEDVIFCQLTSGSTGVPKCIQETHQGIIRHIHAAQQFNCYLAEDITLNWLPVDHVVPILTCHLKDIYLGCSQIHVKTDVVLADPLKWLDLMAAYRVTHSWSPNFGYKLVSDWLAKVKDRQWDLSSIKYLMNAGEQVTLPVVRDFLQRVAPFGVPEHAMQPAFGMAEACTCMTYRNEFSVETGVHRFFKSSLGGRLKKAGGDDTSVATFVDLGPPVPGVQIRITDQNNQLVPEGVIGRFQIKGGVITPGYLNNDAANQEAFVGDGWFNSGDLGFILDGRLTLTGREKEMIIVRGANFYCYEIEDVANAVAGIEPTFVAACAVDDAASGTEGLAIFFVPKAGTLEEQLPIIRAIRAAVTAGLGISPSHVIPIAKESFPKTTSGKIQRTQLKKALAAGQFAPILKEIDTLLENAHTLPDWFYRPIWRRKEATPAGTARIGTTLLFADRLGLGDALRGRLERTGRRCVSVEIGPEFRQLDPWHFRINPAEASHYEKLVASVTCESSPVTEVLHLWTYEDCQAITDARAIDEAQFRGVCNLLALVRALARVQTEKPVRLLIASRHAQPVSPADLPTCQHAPLAGLVKTVSQEMPWIDCRHVDLGDERPEANAPHLFQELASCRDGEVAYRGGQRFVPRLEKVDLRQGEKQPLPFRRGGFYLLSGGLGGIGVELARYLLKQHHARLLLIGRTPLPQRGEWEEYLQHGGIIAERIRALQAMEQLGEVHYAVADIGNAEELRRTVQEASTGWQPDLDGILHLAGIYQERLLADETQSSFMEVLRPKVLGTWALHQLVKDRPGTLFISFSSVMSFFGGAMFGAYAAANRFQETFTHYQRHHCGLQSYCLAWSAWHELGMSRSRDGKGPLRASSRGFEELSVEQGVHSLLAGLHHQEPHLVVGLNANASFIRRHLEAGASRAQKLCAYFTNSNGRLADFSTLEVCDRFDTPTTCEFVQLPELPRTENGDIDRVQLAAPRRRGRELVAPRTETERRLAAIWQELLGVPQIGVEDNFFELGGHSLLAAQVLSQVREAFQVELPLRALFESPTIAGVANSLDQVRQSGQELQSPSLRPVPRDGELPLSFAQQRLWFFDQLVPGTSSYNLPSIYRLTGRLDVAALEKSLSEILRRHESLRTTFPVTAGRPHQVITPVRPVRLDMRDLQPLPGPEREAEAHRLAAEEANSPFDLAQGPVFRAALFRLGPEDHLLVVTAHHIVSDGWSLGVFSRELSALYRAFAASQLSPLPELPVQYVDYAIWQRGWLQGEVLDRQLSYWRKRLAGAAPLKLPTDRPRPEAPRYRGSSQPLALPAQLSRRLRELGQSEGTTLFMTLLTALQALLARYSGQEDVVVGVPVANRNGREIESLIGFFVNNLPVRTNLSGDPSFREVLSRLRGSVLNDFAHQDLPFEKLVEELRLPRETGRIPLCSVLFIFQNGPPPTPDLEGLQVSAVPWDMAPRSDLDLYLWEEGEEVRGTLVFDRDLFECSTIGRLVQQFRTLIESIVADPDTLLSDLALDETKALPALRPARPVGGRYPLSYHQERLWFIDQFETGTVYPSHPIYHNLPLLVHLSGPVRIEDLEAGLRVMVDRHAALRTRIVNAADELFQEVDGAAALELRVKCLAGSSVQQAVEEALADARRPFALDRELPLRATLFRLAHDECLLAVTVHHIVADRRSLEIMAEELAEFCTARAAGRPPRLPQLPLQYTDYTLWQRQLPREALEALLRFWKWRLRGRLAPLELPADRPRPAIHTFTDARLPVVMDVGVTRRLAALGQAAGHGLEAVLLAAWKALLHRYASQDEIVVGVSVGGRNQPRADKVVGPLANLVVLRTDLGGNPPFQDLLAQVARQLQQARAHQEMPFDRLVLELKPEPDMSRTALFDVLFHFDEEPAPLRFGAACGHLIDTNLGYGKYDLHLSLRGSANGLSGSLVYNADIYDRFTAEQLLRHFQALLESVASEPGQPVSDLALLAAEEERQQLEAWNATQASYPDNRTVHQLFEEQAARTPDRIAVVYEEDCLTYRELDERANRLAHHLRDQGVEPDALVAVCLERSVDLVVTLLAVLKAGGAYLPLDPNYPPERLRFQVTDAGARHLVTTARLVSRVPVAVAAVTLLDTDSAAIAARPATTPAPNTGPDNLIYCLYTSGSTGTPKGVLLEHRNVTRLLVNNRLQFTFSADDVWTMFHTYCFDFSVWEMYGALLYGGKLVVVPHCVATDPAAFLALLERERVTVLNQTPTAFAALTREALDHPRPGLALRYVIFGGEALHPGQLRRWREVYPGVKLINMYGITETTVHVTFKEIGDRELEQDVSNIGRPIPTTTTYVLDSRLRLLPVGVPGEMCVGGAGVGRGYLGRPELTRQRFVPNPHRPGERLYRSGDLVKYLANGEMLYLGRIDDQVQVRGFRVELGEVRSQLLSHPAVAAADVIGWQPPGQALELAAYVVLTGEASVASLRDHLSQMLPHYMVPSAFIQLPALPMTPTGKVDRKALPPPQGVRSDETRGFVAPRDPVEERVANIWGQVLGVDRVGVHDNFFELGGHSLRAAQVVAQIWEAFQVKLPLSTLFETPTLAGLAQRIEAARRANPARVAPSLVPALRQGEALPVSFAQHRLWFIDQLLPGSASYNIPTAFRLAGLLRAVALERALAEIVCRHEILRSTLIMRDGQLVQRIAQAGEWRLPQTDLGVLPAGKREIQAQRLALAEAQTPFDLERGPLFRAHLLRLADDDHLLLVTMHHIVCDGWSLDVFIRDLGALYGAFAQDKASPLPRLPVQYADYAVWERDWLRGRVLEERLTHWKQHLTGAPMQLELPADHPRPPVQTLRGARLFFQMPLSLAEQAKTLSQQESCTLFMTLLAAFEAWLHAYTSRVDLLVGCPFANRARPETAGLMGPFVNTHVLRTSLAGRPTFRELLGRVRQVILGADAHQEVPLEKIVEAVRPPRDPSRNPLFQINFRVVTEPLPPLRLEGLTASPLQITDSANSKFDLALELTASPDSFGGFFEYSTDLFEEATIACMRDDLESILRESLARPDAQLESLSAIKAVVERRRAKVSSPSAIPARSKVPGLRNIKRKAVDLKQSDGESERPSPR